jgi:deoxyadenosine/deoxycytidine kinase
MVQVQPLLFINLEGNIGAGKSTILTKIARTPGFHVIQEPIDLWRAPIVSESCYDTSPLALLYSDPGKNGFAFQMYAMETRMQALLAAPPDAEVIIMERSCVSPHDIFGAVMRAKNEMSDLEWHTYQAFRAMTRAMVDRMYPTENERIDIDVYLRTDPVECMRRIHARGRAEESSGITAEYIQSLHALHEAAFIPLLTLDSPSSNSNSTFIQHETTTIPSVPPKNRTTLTLNGAASPDELAAEIIRLVSCMK